MENLFINRIRINKENIDNNKYPFNIKCLSNFDELKIDTSVTLFYGENGVGKSTLIEAIALLYTRLSKKRFPIYNCNTFPNIIIL